MTPQRNGEKRGARSAGVADSRLGADHALLSEAAAGDTGAQEQLVRNHRAAVVAMARARGGRSLGVDDLIQEGLVGLLAAIHSFGQRPAGQFDGYVAECVGRQMDAALESEDVAQQTTNGLVSAADSFERAEYGLARELKRKPTSTEIAERLEWTEERTRAIGEIVSDARRRHDEELLDYLDSDA